VENFKLQTANVVEPSIFVKCGLSMNVQKEAFLKPSGSSQKALRKPSSIFLGGLGFQFFIARDSLAFLLMARRDLPEDLPLGPQ
jgi:hypothetical protein